MKPEICVKIILVSFLTFGVVYCEEDENSEEYMRFVDEVYITPDVPELVLSVNDKLLMTCNGSSINWKSPNGTFVDMLKGRVHVEDSAEGSQTQVLRLIFEAILFEDNGEWTCVGNYDEKSFNIFVYIPIEFVPVHTLITAKEGENVKLDCAANGNPPPQIHWNFRHNRISNLDGNSSSHFINMTDGLFIKNVRRQHSGEYICKAFQMTKSRITDMKELPIQLNVQFEPEIIQSERTKSNGKFDADNLMYIKHAAIKSTHSLICEATSNPLPTFLWYHNDALLSNHHINNTDNLSTLNIILHSNKSFGMYKCIAKNDLGEAEMLVKLVEGKRPERPQIFKLVGSGMNILDIDVGSKRPDKNDPNAITHYRFEITYRDDNNSINWKNSLIKDKKAESNVTYALHGLMPNTKYLIRVASVNPLGISEWSNVQEFKTLDEAPKKTNGSTDMDSKKLNFCLIVLVAMIITQLPLTTY